MQTKLFEDLKPGDFFTQRGAPDAIFMKMEPLSGGDLNAVCLLPFSKRGITVNLDQRHPVLQCTLEIQTEREPDGNSGVYSW